MLFFSSPETSYRAVGRLFYAMLEIDGSDFNMTRRQTGHGGGKGEEGVWLHLPFLWERGLGTAAPPSISFSREGPRGGG